MTTTTTVAKKITLATVKSFINKNRDNIYVNVKSDFNGMTDCVEAINDGFRKVTSDAPKADGTYCEQTQGIPGAWFVGSSRDYFRSFENETLKGYEVTNSCGRWIVATQKTFHDFLNDRLKQRIETGLTGHLML